MLADNENLTEEKALIKNLHKRCVNTVQKRIGNKPNVLVDNHNNI